MDPTIGRIVIYRTDGRNGLSYDLPAIITCTKDSHPGNYPQTGAHLPECATNAFDDFPCDCGPKNPLPVPETELHVHLTVFSPGGFGTTVELPSGVRTEPLNQSFMFLSAQRMFPGSGTYVEWNVPLYEPPEHGEVEPRTWRWPVIK